jgi:hypothetical protein
VYANISANILDDMKLRKIYVIGVGQGGEGCPSHRLRKF